MVTSGRARREPSTRRMQNPAGESDQPSEHREQSVPICPVKQSHTPVESRQRPAPAQDCPIRGPVGGAGQAMGTYWQSCREIKKQAKVRKGMTHGAAKLTWKLARVKRSTASWTSLDEASSNIVKHHCYS